MTFLDHPVPYVPPQGSIFRDIGGGCLRFPEPEPPHIVRMSPPEALLRCRDEPGIPTGDQVMQSNVARYIVRLRSEGPDCRDKLGRVRDFSAESG